MQVSEGEHFIDGAFGSGQGPVRDVVDRPPARCSGYPADNPEDMAQAETAQAGKPIRLSRGLDVPGSIDEVSLFAGAARRLDGMAAAEWSGTDTSVVRRDPVGVVGVVGVVGSIAPWNYPPQMAAWRIVPAIAAGNIDVLEPAGTTPVTTLIRLRQGHVRVLLRRVHLGRARHV